MKEDRVADELRDINKTLEKILIKIPGPAGKFTRIMEIAALFVGVFGVIALIDIVRNWIIGG